MLRSTDLPRPVSIPTDPDPIADLLRRVAALEAENATLRKALAEERRTVDILLEIDALGDAIQRQH
jgi:hypothetical protein